MQINFDINKELKDVIPEPTPASKQIPDWFKGMAGTYTYENNESAFDPETVKRCVPFLDVLSTGYIIPLWSDIAVKSAEDTFTMSWNNSIFSDGHSMVDKHMSEQISTTPIVDLSPFGNQPMKFVNPWVINTEPGWSCLFVSPLNHFEDRFQLISGLVDTDTYYNNINFPFIWMKQNFKGFLERGTPLVQVIPIKRDEYMSKVEIQTMTEENQLEKKKVLNTLATRIYGGYLKFFRQNKKWK